MKSHRLAGFAIAIAACGGGGGGGTGADGTVSAQGTFSGTTLSLTNAIWTTVSDSKGTSLLLDLTERSTCADAPTGPAPNDQIVEIALFSIDGNGSSVAPTGPATFNLDPSSSGPFAEVAMEFLNASCAEDDTDSGVFGSGTVTVTALSSTEITGTLDLSGTNGSATGTFTGEQCGNLVADGTFEFGSGCSD